MTQQRRLLYKSGGQATLCARLLRVRNSQKGRLSYSALRWLNREIRKADEASIQFVRDAWAAGNSRPYVVFQLFVRSRGPVIRAARGNA